MQYFAGKLFYFQYLDSISKSNSLIQGLLTANRPFVFDWIDRLKGTYLRSKGRANDPLS